jgi:hypothetical protein
MLLLLLYYIFLFKWLCWTVTLPYAVGLEQITLNTLRTGDEFSRLWRFFLYNFERQMTQHAQGFYALNHTINKATKKMVAERG